MGGIIMTLDEAIEVIERHRAELAAARSQLKNITENAYILENTIRLLRTENADREKAAIAAALEQVAASFEHLYSGNWIARSIRSFITPDQSAATAHK